ncbi:hypothetical protein Pelo_11173 [Pelomyxa schiedti]|nr:hypothetical protein Pelo_11173 [Pelomyxa schiedti]
MGQGHGKEKIVGGVSCLDVAKSTGLGVEQVQLLFEEWLRSGNKYTVMDRDHFVEFMGRMAPAFPDVPAVQERGFAFALFELLDQDHTGRVSFQNLASGMAILAQGDADAKAKMLFQSCDLNHDGSITRDELRESIAKAVKSTVLLMMFKYSSTGEAETPASASERAAKIKALTNQLTSKTEIDQFVTAIFAADDNNDGSLSCDEWLHHYKTNPALYRFFQFSTGQLTAHLSSVSGDQINVEDVALVPMKS